MSSVRGKLELKDADGLLDNSSSSPKNCSDGAKHLSLNDSEDTQESEGDDSGNKQGGCEALKNNVTELCSSDTHSPGDLSPRSSEDEDEDFGTALQQIFTEPTPTRLISAMKGSREKHGLMLKKRSVSWAPDVYDPPPSIVSHTRGKKQQKSRSKDKDNHKKNGKKGQKGGNSSRGGKDKKQLRKNACEKFDMGSTDSYCGGSFLKTNLTKVHYSVAEAL